MTDWTQVLYIVLVLIIMLPTIFYIFRQQKALRNIAIWVAIFTALILGYHYLVEVPKMQGLGLPEAPAVQTDKPGDAPAVQTL